MLKGHLKYMSCGEWHPRFLQNDWQYKPSIVLQLAFQLRRPSLLTRIATNEKEFLVLLCKVDNSTKYYSFYLLIINLYLYLCYWKNRLNIILHYCEFSSKAVSIPIHFRKHFIVINRGILGNGIFWLTEFQWFYIFFFISTYYLYSSFLTRLIMTS